MIAVPWVFLHVIIVCTGGLAIPKHPIGCFTMVVPELACWPFLYGWTVVPHGWHCSWQRVPRAGAHQKHTWNPGLGHSMLRMVPNLQHVHKNCQNEIIEALNTTQPQLSKISHALLPVLMRRCSCGWSSQRRDHLEQCWAVDVDHDHCIYWPLLSSISFSFTYGSDWISINGTTTYVPNTIEQWEYGSIVNLLVLEWNFWLTLICHFLWAVIDSRTFTIIDIHNPLSSDILGARFSSAVMRTIGNKIQLCGFRSQLLYTPVLSQLARNGWGSWAATVVETIAALMLPKVEKRWKKFTNKAFVAFQYQFCEVYLSCRMSFVPPTRKCMIQVF